MAAANTRLAGSGNRRECNLKTGFRRPEVGAQRASKDSETLRGPLRGLLRVTARHFPQAFGPHLTAVFLHRKYGCLPSAVSVDSMSFATGPSDHSERRAE